MPGKERENLVSRNYGAYGESAASAGARMLYAGELLEHDTGWYLLGQRPYSPVLRRFLAPDPSSPFGDGGGNRYAYCNGDPVNRIDPTGESWLNWLVAGITMTFAVAAVVASAGMASGMIMPAAGAVASAAASGGMAAAAVKAVAVATPAMAAATAAVAADAVGVVAAIGSTVTMATQDATWNAVFGWVAMGAGMASGVGMVAAVKLQAAGSGVGKAALKAPAAARSSPGKAAAHMSGGSTTNTVVRSIRTGMDTLRQTAVTGTRAAQVAPNRMAEDASTRGALSAKATVSMSGYVRGSSGHGDISRPSAPYDNPRDPNQTSALENAQVPVSQTNPRTRGQTQEQLTDIGRRVEVTVAGTVDETTLRALNFPEVLPGDPEWTGPYV
ncbi:RHS repeat-associated core domain-containing protein [Luteibacter sp.]|jgi:RHS repeat-associated protein|uniref:RHS repeat-associated core domain-containing protein n=1 Tax=Luteibacter sp. TaxID=1886636 RepID=UPI002F3FBF72